MSGLLGKVLGQSSSQGSQSASTSSILHKVSDAVTGQRHPQDGQPPQSHAPIGGFPYCQHQQPEHTQGHSNGYEGFGYRPNHGNYNPEHAGHPVRREEYGMNDHGRPYAGHGAEQGGYGQGHGSYNAGHPGMYGEYNRSEHGAPYAGHGAEQGGYGQGHGSYNAGHPEMYREHNSGGHGPPYTGHGAEQGSYAGYNEH